MHLSTVFSMHMVPSCKVSLKKSDKVIDFCLFAICHYALVFFFFSSADQIQEASVELDTIKDSRDVSLCTLMALVYAEKKKTNPGKPT